MIKFFIQALGCQMSKSDAERLAGWLESLGLEYTDKEAGADILIVNACSVRQSAIDRVFGSIRKWSKCKKKNQVTILTGCVLPVDKKKFSEKFDLVLDIGEYGKLKQWLVRKFGSRIKKTRKQKNKPGGAGSGFAGKTNDEFKDYLEVIPHYHSQFTALVPIMTGCNNFCSYCAVPYVRGRERSRSVRSVLEEIKKLAKAGFVEIVLLGQNVNSFDPSDKKVFSKKNPYHHNFAALLWEINQIKGIKRIFFTAPHPKDMADEVIDALALPQMVNYLHLPVQAGSDSVLQRMNRHYRAKDYLALVKKIRKKCPKIALGTDIIVGFPGETRGSFLKTIKLYKAVKFDISYNARYSPRSGTVAARLADNVSRQEKERRWWQLQRLMEKITLEKNKKYRGKIVSVLVDSFKNGQCQGNSSEMKRVEFKGDKNLVGKIVEVKINRPLTWILRGKVLNG